MQIADANTLRVDVNRRGEWEVAVPDRTDPVRCRTLEEARRVVDRCLAELTPCEVVFLDAYHRVLHRERPATTP